MNRVTEILMDRDDMTFEEAEALRLECADALEHGYDEAIQDYLGLEDDYIFDVLGYV